MSAGEALFALQLRADKLQGWEREYTFAPGRRWRFDFANPALMLAVEIEGGIWSGGRHTRGSGYTADMTKYNRATLLGWRVLRFSTEQVKSGEAIKMVQEALHANVESQ
jgi:very-short-patch-repair endonuclease